MNRVYVCCVKLGRKKPDFEKPCRDRGPQPRTLYSSLSNRPGFVDQVKPRLTFFRTGIGWSFQSLWMTDGGTIPLFGWVMYFCEGAK